MKQTPSLSGTDILPGDIVLFHGTHWQARLIAIGQAIARPGSPLNHWTHAAIAVSGNAHPPDFCLGFTGAYIVEALGRGVCGRIFDPTEHSDHLVIHLGMNPHDRRQVAGFAKARMGCRYGWLTILSIAFNLLTPWLPITFGLDGTCICSGLVARALERAGYDWPKNPANITPADLAERLT